jgi:hypothetical protein
MSKPSDLENILFVCIVGGAALAAVLVGVLQ